jgi:hypothetical protein
MKEAWRRVREWLSGLASIGDFIEAAWLVLLIGAIVIGGVLILGENLLEWLR